MKNIRSLLIGMLFGGSLIAGLHLLHAQETAMPVRGGISTIGTNMDWSSASDLQVMLQAVEMTPTLSPDAVPQSGTFWSVQNPNWPPLPGNINQVPVWSLGQDQFLLSDLGVNYSAPVSMRTAGGMMAMDDGLLPPGGGTNVYSGGYTNTYSAYSFDTNLLWLKITNVANGLAYLNLHNATNQVYEIWSKTNLLEADWDIEQEIWPTDTNCMPFTIPTLNRPDALFVWARDWTDVTSGGNETPEWWFWYYYGTVDLSDTNLDSGGVNTLWEDYWYGDDPNVISFAIVVTNNYVNTRYPNLPLDITAGTPSYCAVLVNDTNLADANWQPYTSSNAVATLGPADGIYNVSVGLRGLPPDATQTWLGLQLTLDTAPPALVITNPVTTTVSQPLIQVQGYANEALSSLAFDVSNATSLATNQTGCLTGGFFDMNLLEFTTNYFQCYDVPLAEGLNTVTIHATDLAGNTTVTNFNVTLDYSGATNPAAPVVAWPPDGTTVGGTNFTLQGSVSDPTATVTVTIVDAGGNTNVVQGVVNRNGQFVAGNIPVGGASSVTVTVTSAAGNSSSTSLAVTGLDAGLTMNPLTGNFSTNTTVNASGSIDAGYSVTVNGVPATISGDPVWTATVPLPAGNPMNFEVKLYDTNDTQVADQVFSQWRPPTVHAAAYDYVEYDQYYQSGYGDCGEQLVGFDEWEDWNSQDGGTNYDVETDWIGDCDYPVVTNFNSRFDPSNSPNLYNPHLLSEPFYNWEYGDISAFASSEQEYYRMRTKVVIDPNGQGTAGAMKNYLVWASAIELYWSPSYFEALPPEWLQIQGQTLADSGMTNNFSVFDDEDIAVRGYTVVTARAGTLVDVTPVAVRTHNGNFYQLDTEYYPVTDYMFDVQACEFPAPVTDANRDGQIAFDGSDDTTAAKPYRFWINDSQENGDIASGADAQIPGSNSPNWNGDQVYGASDLVNFFPVALNLGGILQQCPLTNGFEYHLSQADSAVKFVYSSLTQGGAFDYLTDVTATNGYGVNGDEAVTNADTILVTNSEASGTVLDTNWLTQAQNNGGVGIILMEGCAATTSPLMLEVWHKDNLGTLHKLGSVPMYLSISGVEQMFRCLNLCNYGNGTLDPYAASRATISNEPLTDGKNLVFVHGYNVNQQEARGVESEMFKRFYWSGSKASFYGVTWNGAESQITAAGFTPNYHTNVVNALDTASAFAIFLGNLSGQTTVAAHSLGNMVVLSAISDYGATPSQYFMLDAAVPMEALQGNVEQDTNLIYPDWASYSQRLYASSWWQLFTNGDARSTLTWSNRLGNLGSVDIYNFYSSGEEVLREYAGGIPPTEVSVSEAQLAYWFANWSTWFQDIYGNVTPVGSYVWQWQEMLKGRGGSDEWIGSMHGGWAFNPYYYSGHDPVGGNHLSYSDAAALPDSQLQTNAFFDFSSGYIDLVDNQGYVYDTDDLALYGSGGSAYASANRNRILSDAIPALTFAVGANAATNLDIRAGNKRNFNMQTSFETGWPASRLTTGEKNNNWHHSDFDYVAYPFTSQLFNQIVNNGNLH